MKHELKDFTAPRNAEIITDFEILKTSGRINHGFILAKDDVIEFPDDLESSHVWRSEFNGKNVFHIGVLYNNKLVGMPIGSLRRMPHDYTEAFKDAPVNLALLKDENDYERLQVVFGKKIRVKEVVELDKTIYDPTTNRAKVNPTTGQRELEKARFPIFEFV